MKHLAHDKIKHKQIASGELRKPLKPMRDKKALRLDILCDVIKEIVPDNACSVIAGGIIINMETVIPKDGLAEVNSGLRFRYKDLFEFVLELKKEKILYCEGEDLKPIRELYFKRLNEPWTT